MCHGVLGDIHELSWVGPKKAEPYCGHIVGLDDFFYLKDTRAQFPSEL
jgi:hypothetical protein